MSGVGKGNQVGGKGKILAGVLLAAVFLLAYRVIPVRLEEERVHLLAGSLSNRIIVVDGAYGGFAGEGSRTAAKLTRWLAEAGAMVVLSGDLEPALAYPGAPSRDITALAALAGERKGDLLVSVRPGAGWLITYPAGEQQLAEDIRQEITLAVGAGRPYPASVSGPPGPVPWVQVQTPPLDGRGEDNLAWAVYAGIVRYFAAKPPVVNEKVLETLEKDIPSTVDSR